ncbi:MAG TPA: hypothetical protein VN458_12915 [Solirubrobacterales bacterium]|nr:hypothetical protein [Solirubrobacterales bacterium]
MQNIVTAPIRASRHLAIWLVWQFTGITLLAPDSRSPVPRIHEDREAGRERLPRAS